MQANDVGEVNSQYQQKCQNAVASFKRDIQKLRTGRASAGLLEGVMVEYYGAKTALSHLASISTPEPRLILLQVYDSNAVASVEKAIKTSDLGFNPSREGNSIRITVPQMTEQTRKDVVKLLHKMAEEHRVSIRNNRRDANNALKQLEKDGKLAQDDSKKAQEKTQKQTDSYIAEVDKLLTHKEAEVMEV